ncbi:MAG: type II secretion system F family protein [Alphaproteobacteria bacterium]|nr:type II secretion system F family protein [Alphaproteobacteria bacterium]
MTAIDPILFLYGAVFLMVLLMVEGAWFLLQDLRGQTGQSRVNRRLRMLAAGTEAREVMRTLRRKPAAKGGLEALLREVTPLGALDRLIQGAGWSVPTNRMAAAMALAAVAAFVGMYYGVRVDMARALLFALTPLVAPPLILAMAARRRLRAFARQLPEAIEMVVRSLRAGHPVATAIAMVAREMPDPIGSEFGLAYDEMTYGLDLREALDNLALRVPVDELRYLVVAVRIQFGTGGNLAEVLSGLSRVIRDRERMHGRIKALSAEGKLSAMILIALPFVVVGAVAVFSPGYYLAVKDDPLFLPLIGSGLGSMVLGAVMMNRMVGFRV